MITFWRLLYICKVVEKRNIHDLVLGNLEFSTIQFTPIEVFSTKQSGCFFTLTYVHCVSTHGQSRVNCSVESCRTLFGPMLIPSFLFSSWVDSFRLSGIYTFESFPPSLSNNALSFSDSRLLKCICILAAIWRSNMCCSYLRLELRF